MATASPYNFTFFVCRVDLTLLTQSAVPVPVPRLRRILHHGRPARTAQRRRWRVFMLGQNGNTSQGGVPYSGLRHLRIAAGHLPRVCGTRDGYDHQARNMVYDWFQGYGPKSTLVIAFVMSICGACITAACKFLTGVVSKDIKTLVLKGIIFFIPTVRNFSPKPGSDCRLIYCFQINTKSRSWI